MKPNPLSCAALTLFFVGCSSSQPQEAPGSDEIAITATTAASPYAVRILAGSAPNATPYTDANGDTWLPDTSFDVGSALQNQDAIRGTADAALFHGERWASRTSYPNGFAYTFKSVPPGTYRVSLRFAETSVNPVRAAGERQFDVVVNGDKVLDGLDIFAEVGIDTALEKSFVASPQNGAITIRFAPGAVQNPKVSAIEIVPSALHPIAARFFGIHLNEYGTALKYGSHRLWDAGVGWWALQTGKDTYDFQPLKNRVAKAPPGVELMYTFGHTPSSVARGGFTCAHGPGDCNPPADVDTTDAAVKGFWTEFMKEMCTGTAPHKTCGPIKYFEMWNEPNGDNFWSGTYDQLAKMSSDATAIIKENCASCVVLTANASCGGDAYHANGESGRCDVWMDGYLAAWQKHGHMPDAGSWHAYPSHTNVSPSPLPETNVSSWDTCTHGDAAGCTCKAGYVPSTACRYSIAQQFDVMRGVFDAHGLAGKPIYVTEGGWNLDSSLSDPDMQAAFLARWFLLQAGEGVSAAYWYAQDNTTWGTLVDTSGGLNQAGRAFNRVYDWLVGSSIGRCSASGSAWSCPVVRADGTAALLVWDGGLRCSGGTCATRAFPVSAAYTRVDSLGGASGTITNGTVAIGAKPVLLHR